jgi:hypothetical protein
LAAHILQQVGTLENNPVVGNLAVLQEAYTLDVVEIPYVPAVAGTLQSAEDSLALEGSLKDTEYSHSMRFNALEGSLKDTGYSHSMRCNDLEGSLKDTEYSHSMRCNALEGSLKDTEYSHSMRCNCVSPLQNLLYLWFI